jgi:hypothetical protein
MSVYLAHKPQIHLRRVPNRSGKLREIYSSICIRNSVLRIYRMGIRETPRDKQTRIGLGCRPCAVSTRHPARSRLQLLGSTIYWATRCIGVCSSSESIQSHGEARAPGVGRARLRQDAMVPLHGNRRRRHGILHRRVRPLLHLARHQAAGPNLLHRPDQARPGVAAAQHRRRGERRRALRHPRGPALLRLARRQAGPEERLRVHSDPHGDLLHRVGPLVRAHA